MTTQRLHLDLIDYRQGKIDMDELRRRFPTWQVSKDYARECVEYAKQAMIVQPTDLFA